MSALDLSRCSVLTALALSLFAACRKPQSKSDAPAPSASVQTKPVDRLAPGELAPGDGELFGLNVPRGMLIDGKFKELAIASGRIAADAVANYVRDQVAAEHVEIGAARTVFPNARIKRGRPERTYRIEVLQDGLTTRLLVRDVTPAPPRTDLKGLSTEELWRRAGFSRDGKPLNPKALE